MHQTTACGPLVPSRPDARKPLKQQVFEHVRAMGNTARSDIAKSLFLSPASVTTATADLIQARYLKEIPATRNPSDTGRGRPPVALAIRADIGHVAGLKLSDRDFTAVIANFAGVVVASASVPVSSTAHDPSHVLDICNDLVHELCTEVGIARDTLAAIGIGAPGFVDNASGTVIWSPVLSGRDMAFADAASARLGRPVIIDNDANLVTLAELWFGAGRHVADFAVITIEHGLGMGYVSGHRLLRGSRGIGTELGHTKVALDGALCRCGQRGCLEAYLADYALAREARVALAGPSADTASTTELLDRLRTEAVNGHPAARKVFEQAGRYLALGLANVSNLFDPARIILSGARVPYDTLWSDDVYRELAELTLNTGRPLPKVEVHAWGDLLWARGAAALALSRAVDDQLGSG